MQICKFKNIVLYLRKNTKYHLKLERNAYLIHLSWCPMLFCIANGMLNQVQSEKAEKLSGQIFSPLVEHAVYAAGIGLQT